MPDVQALVNDFVNKLRKRKIEGSQATAKHTAEFLRSVISQQRIPYTNQAGALIDAVKAVGEQLIAANPVELAVGNIVRRVLHIIREEDLSLTTAAIGDLNISVGNVPNASAAPLSSSGGDSEGKSKSADRSSRIRKLKHDVIESVNDLIQDIDTCHEQIAEQAVEHIHQNEVILTLGRSRTVMEFLCAAKEKKRSFKVFVAEGAPRYQGHVLAKELVARGLQTTVITDSAVFAMISRVNMVIVGAHAVMANGGLIAPVGLNMVALAAQRHAVPFVVVAGSHKLCPLYPHNPEVLLNELKSPSDLLDFGEFSDCMDFGSGSGKPLLHIVNPTFDYVPPKLVSLFITDTWGKEGELSGGWGFEKEGGYGGDLGKGKGSRVGLMGRRSGGRDMSTGSMGKGWWLLLVAQVLYEFTTLKDWLQIAARDL
uniref:Translation initiation factor eIF2B subunit beta n=1 Tax=Chenopodium quinoa TaxID=63459 RepID=A0A803NBC9_CHEQI